LGYSDHTLGIEAVPLAVAAGARIVEKHFTLDKNRSSFRDHQISADPNELKSLVSRIRAVECQMGTGLLEVRACELASSKALRRSIAASRPLEKNTILQIADLTWVRPGVGIPPGSEDRVLGRRLNKSKLLGELILEEDFSTA
jgi:sialic acid synthase SpsE